MATLRNPIFQREFLGAIRSWRNNFLVWAYLLALAFLLFILWPGSGVLSKVSSTGKQIFSLFFSTNLTLLILLVPAFTATSITYEKENSTYSALFTTLLTPIDIMLGKLFASTALLLIIVFLSMPIASVCALTGGVSISFMAQIITLLIVTAISYGLIGLVCSTLCRRSTNAIMLNYVIILVLAGGSWLPDALLGNLLPGLRTVWQYIRSLSPFDALFYLLYPENYSATMNVHKGTMMLSPYQVFMIFSIILGILSLIMFYLKIIRPSTSNTGLRGDLFDDKKKALKRKLSWPFYLIDPLKRKKMIGKYSNPVFVAEIRSKLFANPKFVLRTVSAIFVISLTLLTLIALQFGDSLRADTVRMVAIIFQIGVVAMLAPSVSSGLITDEITGRTFTALRLTLMTPFRIIFGKLKATFFYAMIFIISSLFILLAMAYLEHQNVFPEASIFTGDYWNTLLPKVKTIKWWIELWETYRRVVAWVGILLLSTVTFLSAGLFASSISRTTGVATAVGYSLTAVICLVSFAPVVLGERLTPQYASLILSFNPIASAMQVTSDAFTSYPNLWMNNLMLLIGLTGLFLFAAIIRTWYLFRKQE